MAKYCETVVDFKKAVTLLVDPNTPQFELVCNGKAVILRIAVADKKWFNGYFAGKWKERSSCAFVNV
jgi:hypothetical protein